jgi:hypothetical protein
MQRKALVVGVSQYNKVSLGNFVSFANNANAIADILEPTFKVKRFPEAVDGDLVRVGKSAVTCDRLQNELKELFTAADLDLVLFYFSGHGLKGKQLFPRTYLAASDSEGLDDGYRRAFEIEDLKSLLKNCPAKEQIVWLDCCYGGDLANFADVCDRNDDKTRFIITASRSQDPAYQEIAGEMGVFTRVLVEEALARTGITERRITCAAIEDAVREKLQSLQYPQMPQFYRTPNKIIEFWARRVRLQENHKRKKSIEEEIAALNNQITMSPNRVDRIRLKRQFEDLFEELDDLSKEIDSINTTEQKDEFTKLHLAEIDFKESRKQISEKCKSLEDEGGFLGFIIENCHNYKGDLLIEVIRDQFKNGKPNFKEIIIDPRSGNLTNNHGWIMCIAESLKISLDRALLTPEILVDTIIQDCCSYQTFFFELRNWGDLEDSQTKLLDQFYNTFWMSLIERKSQILSRVKNVCFVSVVSDGGILHERCFNLRFQNIKINLINWTEKDIENWLGKRKSFNSDEELEKEARKIFRESQGMPLGVYAKLQEHFCFI